MNRVKLFFFFAIMAWVSVISPQEGNDLIDCAEAGARGTVRQDRPAPSGVGIWVLALLALGISLAWAVWLVCQALSLIAG